MEPYMLLFCALFLHQFGPLKLERIKLFDFVS